MSAFQPKLKGSTESHAQGCADYADALKRCMRKTDCCRVEEKTVKECLRILPDECVPLRRSYFMCRRGQLDMRSRIRGVGGSHGL